MARSTTPRPGTPDLPRLLAPALRAGAGWRVEQARFELRRPFDAEGGRWIATALLACVERPARGGGAAALLANGHVHLWPPARRPEATGGGERPGWILREAARFTAAGWAVSWDPANGRFAWLARPLEGSLAPLAEARDFLEGAFARDRAPPTSAGQGPTRSAGGRVPEGTARAAVPRALELLASGPWSPSAFVMARRGVPVAALGGTVDLEVRLVGSDGGRRASPGRLRGEVEVVLWIGGAAPRAGGGRDLAGIERARRALWARLRGLGLHRLREPPGSPRLRFAGRVAARPVALRAMAARLERAVAGPSRSPSADDPRLAPTAPSGL